MENPIFIFSAIPEQPFMKSTLIILLSVICLLAPVSNGFSQILDPSFGNNGIVITDIAGKGDQGRALLIQPDGKIIIGGFSNNFSLVRYYPNGSIDSSFGINGKVITHLSTNASKCYSLILQSDGKILAGGVDYSYIPFFAIARYKPDGIVDSSFGVNGVARVNFGGSDAIIYSMAIQPDGKIVVGGYSHKSVSNFDCEFAFARFQSNGILDTSFGNGGRVVTDLSIGDDECEKIAIQPDGKILAVGFGTEDIYSNQGYNFIIVRYNSNGKLDSTFNSDGITSIDFSDYGESSSVDFPGALTLLSNGKILVGGDTHGIPGLARLNADGSLDGSFGLNGKVPPFNGGFGPITTMIGLQDNSIIATANINGDFGLLKYKQNGTLDSSFGIAGYITTDIGASDYSTASMFQSDKKLVVSGFSGFGYTDNDSYDFAMVRYILDGALPITLSAFSADKKQTSVLLNWQTANEQNNAYFAIERSNGSNNNFKVVGRVNSKGDLYKPQQYSFEDFNPSNGGNYYRLKQVDADGKSSYSKVAFVDFSKPFTIKLYPNPVKDILTLEGLSTNANISIISLQGSVLAKTTAGSKTYTWDIKQLPAGTYYVRIEADKNFSTLKFVKE